MHAYTLLKVDTLKFKDKSLKMVQLRNPWGSGQFNGSWSDKDKNWNLVDASEKKRIGYVGDNDDGIFFMSWEDFWKKF